MNRPKVWKVLYCIVGKQVSLNNLLEYYSNSIIELRLRTFDAAFTLENTHAI